LHSWYSVVAHLHAATRQLPGKWTWPLFLISCPQLRQFFIRGCAVFPRAAVSTRVTPFVSHKNVFIAFPAYFVAKSVLPMTGAGSNGAMFRLSSQCCPERQFFQQRYVLCGVDGLLAFCQLFLNLRTQHVIFMQILTRKSPHCAIRRFIIIFEFV